MWLTSAAIFVCVIIHDKVIQGQMTEEPVVSSTYTCEGDTAKLEFVFNQQNLADAIEIYAQQEEPNFGQSLIIRKPNKTAQTSDFRSRLMWQDDSNAVSYTIKNVSGSDEGIFGCHLVIGQSFIRRQLRLVVLKTGECPDRKKFYSPNITLLQMSSEANHQGNTYLLKAPGNVNFMIPIPAATPPVTCVVSTNSEEYTCMGTTGSDKTCEIEIVYPTVGDNNINVYLSHLGLERSQTIIQVHIEEPMDSEESSSPTVVVWVIVAIVIIAIIAALAILLFIRRKRQHKPYNAIPTEADKPESDKKNNENPTAIDEESPEYVQSPDKTNLIPIEASFNEANPPAVHPGIDEPDHEPELQNGDINAPAITSMKEDDAHSEHSNDDGIGTKGDDIETASDAQESDTDQTTVAPYMSKGEIGSNPELQEDQDIPPDVFQENTELPEPDVLQGNTELPEPDVFQGNTELPEEKIADCAICMEVPVNPVALPVCKHIFCKNCIDPWFEKNPKCPTCDLLYGEMTGDQPEGTMSVTVAGGSLPGFDTESMIVITYNIPDGVQNENHPNPGQPYYGTNKTAFLPNNEDGNEIANLLRRAFDAKLIFTIGSSATTGHDGQVTWADIHHKTNMSGGAKRLSYPDPDYLSIVRRELAAKGIE